METDQPTATETPAPQETPPAVQPQQGAPVVNSGGFFWGTGRRKAAVARVRIKPGDGKFMINGRRIDDYFTEIQDRNNVVSPLKATNTEGKLNVLIKVHGGGYTGQSGAIALGLSRALNGYDPSLLPILREKKLLSRDPRRVERKKYGQPGARKRFQFSKR